MARTVVIVREDSPGDQRLVAYVVPTADMPDTHVLREHLRTMLPEYMVPQYFVPIPAIPLLPNGKINHNALPKPLPDALHTSEDSSAASHPPQTPAEVAIAAIWQRLLGVQNIGLRDNFFDLGGHSLLAMRAVTEINKTAGVNISVRQLIFESLGQIAHAASLETTKPAKGWARRAQGTLKVEPWIFYPPLLYSRFQ